MKMTIEEIEKLLHVYGIREWQLGMANATISLQKNSDFLQKKIIAAGDAEDALLRAIIEYGGKCAKKAYELGKVDALHPIYP